MQRIETTEQTLGPANGPLALALAEARRRGSRLAGSWRWSGPLLDRPLYPAHLLAADADEDASPAFPWREPESGSVPGGARFPAGSSPQGARRNPQQPPESTSGSRDLDPAALEPGCSAAIQAGDSATLQPTDAAVPPAPRGQDGTQWHSGPPSQSPQEPVSGSRSQDSTELDPGFPSARRAGDSAAPKRVNAAVPPAAPDPNGTKWHPGQPLEVPPELTSGSRDPHSVASRCGHAAPFPGVPAISRAPCDSIVTLLGRSASATIPIATPESSTADHARTMTATLRATDNPDRPGTRPHAVPGAESPRVVADDEPLTPDAAGLPQKRAEPAGDRAQSPPPGTGFPGAPPLPYRTKAPPRATGSSPGVSASLPEPMQEVLAEMIKHEVAAAMAAVKRETGNGAQGRSGATGLGSDGLDEDAARRLMARLRTLAEEDRFRSGNPGG